MKNKKTIIIVAVLVLVLGGASILYKQLGQNFAGDQLSGQTGGAQTSENGSSAEPEKIPAVDVTVYDIDGNEVHLSDYFGKPIVMNFWASWCNPCQSEMPDFNEAYAELGEGVQFLMINATDGARETVEKASKFVNDRGYTFPVFYDTDSEAVMTYGAYALPTTYFIDAEGYVVAQARGAIDKETLQRGIDMITE